MTKMTGKSIRQFFLLFCYKPRIWEQRKMIFLNLARTSYSILNSAQNELRAFRNLFTFNYFFNSHFREQQKAVNGFICIPGMRRLLSLCRQAAKIPFHKFYYFAFLISSLSMKNGLSAYPILRPIIPIVTITNTNELKSSYIWYNLVRYC